MWKEFPGLEINTIKLVSKVEIPLKVSFRILLPTKLTKESNLGNINKIAADFRRYAGIPDFLTADDMEGMVSDNRLDPKMIFSYVQEVYRMCNEM